MSMRRIVLAAFVASAALSAGPALAQQDQPAPPGANRPSDPKELGAAEVVGLLMDTCVHFAGNPGGLRAWLAQQGVPDMAGEGRPLFLGKRTGKVYDASEENLRLALVSADDGSCSAYAEIADPALTTQYLEEALGQSKNAFTRLEDRPDQQDPSLHHRDYRVSIGSRQWLILVTTTAAQGRIQAALTMRPQ
jgi:hypothetical protein